MKVVYIIPRMAYGGGMLHILAEVKQIRQITPNFTATVVAIETSLSTNLMTEALANGLKVLLSPSPSLLGKLVANADLTVVYYWNCPSMFRFFRFLADSTIPHRLCLNTAINGFTLPQVVPAWVYAACHLFITAHPRTPTDGLRPDIENRFIPCFIRLPEQAEPPRLPDFGSFRLFHAGTLNYFKAHPELISLHEGLRISQYQFDIWGAGMDKIFEDDLAQAKSVVYRGFSKDMYTDMAPYHLLCNPQTELSYGSFDKIMWESQWMGKPVIVLKNSYIADHILHNINGIVADDTYAYRAALEDLAAQPSTYKSLAESTLHHIHTHYKLADYASEVIELYKRTTQKPLTILDPASVPQHPEEAALDGLGNWKHTLLTHPESLSPMEIKYALRCEGGLIHYYKAYPDNPALQALITQLITLEEFVAQ